MYKNCNTPLPGLCALIILLCLSLGWLECRADDTNSFPDPLPAEQFVTNHLTDQEFIDLSASTGSASVTNRTVRGQFLEWLLTKHGKQLPHGGLRLKNAIIEGSLDLCNEEVPAQVWLQCCHFKTNVNLSSTHFGHDLRFEGCLFDGEFLASALRVDSSLELKPYTLANKWEASSSEAPPGEESLTNYLGTNQTIQSWSPGHGKFILDASQLNREWLIKDPRNFNITNQWTNEFKSTALGDSMFLVQRNDDVPAQATNSVRNLTIGPLTKQWKMATNTGTLDLNSVRTQLATALGTNMELISHHVGTNPPIDLDKNLEFIQDNVLTTNASNSTVSVRWLFDNPTDPASLPLVAKWYQGSPMVKFSQPTIFRKRVALDRAVISGKLDAEDVEFRGEFYGQSLKVGDSMVMTEARFAGATRFIYAQIARDFYFEKCSFQFFDASGMSVGGSLIINWARFCNTARFDEVTVGMAFRGQYVRFENRSALAEFRGLNVDGLVDFQRAQFAGPVNFILAHVKGNFQAQDATFEDNHPFLALQILTGDTFTFNTDFGSMQVDGFAVFENALFARSVSFRNARFGNLYLDGVRWPEARILLSYTDDPKTNDLLRLEGMDFQTIRDVTSGHFLHTPEQLEESQTNLLNMFANRSPYSFDIYAKLEKYFQREGAPGLADGVFLKAKEREGKEATGLAKFTNTLLDWTVGYGRQPWKAFLESCIFVVVWGGLCRRCLVKRASKRGPDWGLALFFSLGTFLPIIDLGAKELLEIRAGKEWFRYLIALEKILGYILVPLWTMALTGLIK